MRCGRSARPRPARERFRTVRGGLLPVRRPGGCWRASATPHCFEGRRGHAGTGRCRQAQQRGEGRGVWEDIRGIDVSHTRRPLRGGGQFPQTCSRDQAAPGLPPVSARHRSLRPPESTRGAQVRRSTIQPVVFGCVFASCSLRAASLHIATTQATTASQTIGMSISSISIGDLGLDTAARR
jgi:hypothetical protein